MNGEYYLVQNAPYNQKKINDDMQFQKLVDEDNPSLNEDMTSLWTLNSLEREEMINNPNYVPEDLNKFDNDEYLNPAKFYIENLQLTRAGRFMRLAQQKSSYQMQVSKTRLYTTSRDQRGYKDNNQAVWTISRYQPKDRDWKNCDHGIRNQRAILAWFISDIIIYWRNYYSNRIIIFGEVISSV